MIVQQPTAWFALKQYCLTSCFVFLLADTGLAQPNSVYTTTTEVGQYTLPVIMPSIWDVPPGYSPAALKEKSSEIDRIRTSELANEMLVSRMLDRTENEILASQQVIALYPAVCGTSSDRVGGVRPSHPICHCNDTAERDYRARPIEYSQGEHLGNSARGHRWLCPGAGCWSSRCPRSGAPN
jgi:hypothetical protein